MSTQGSLTLEILSADAMRGCMGDLAVLAAAACEPNPFFAPFMLAPALDLLDETRDMRFALVRNGERLVGFLPLERASGYAHLPVSYWRTALYRHCFLGTPLVLPGYEEAFFRTLISGFHATGLGGAFLQFRHLYTGSHVETALASVAGQNSYVSARWQRACLDSDLAYEGYILANIRGKKRKEWRRLTNRLSEEGPVSFTTLESAEQLEEWCDTFLALENDGWRGHGGTSLSSEENGPDYLKAIVNSAFENSSLDFLRLDVGDRCIGMLINFRQGVKGWSFKIAHDADFARYSPGVMIELELTRRALDDGAYDQIDSCAQEDHPMIDKIWAERNELCQWNVPLPGLARSSTVAVCRFLEEASDRTRRLLGTKGVSA